MAGAPSRLLFVAFAAALLSILEKLHTDLMRTRQASDVQQRLAQLVIDRAPTSRDDFSTFIRPELSRWTTLVKDAGIPPR